MISRSRATLGLPRYGSRSCSHAGDSRCRRMLELISLVVLAQVLPYIADLLKYVGYLQAAAGLVNNVILPLVDTSVRPPAPFAAVSSPCCTDF